MDLDPDLSAHRLAANANVALEAALEALHAAPPTREGRMAGLCREVASLCPPL